VRGADVTGPYARPDRVIPQFGQVPKYAVKPAAAERGHVLHDDNLRS
jgi:hypothetical protein